MKLSRFFQQVSEIRDDLDMWSLSLATPHPVEGKGVHVMIAAPQRIEVDLAKGQVRFIPRRQSDDGTLPAAAFLSAALELLPRQAGGSTDLSLMVELPLVERPREKNQRSVVEIVSLHLGPSSQEAWLLLRPAGEFPADELPT